MTLSTAAAPLVRIARSVDPRHRLVRAFPALSHRNYRLYVLSQLLTNPSGWMQRIAQDWLILQLTGSVTLVGLAVTLQLGPMLAFGLWGGALADRFPKRAILSVTQSVFAASALTLGVLTIGGWIQAWQLLLGAFTLGLATVADNPARQAFAAELAGTENLRSAISLNSTVFQIGALVGPALAGVSIAAIGEGPAFLINAAAGVVAVALLMRMNPATMSTPTRVPRGRGQVREGLRYATSTPTVFWAATLIGLVALTGINMTTVLAAYADTVFDSGAQGYGLLTGSVAAGAVIGATASSRRTRIGLRQLVYLALALGALQLVAAQLSNLAAFAAVLVAVGAISLYYLTGSNTLVQLSTDPLLRGRVMAIYIMVFFGAQALSGTLIGSVAHHAGPQVAMTVTAAGPILGAVLVGSVLAYRRRLRPTLIWHDRPGRGLIYVRPFG